MFLSNNYEDRLFKPDAALNYFQQLQVPKFSMLNTGVHATPQRPSLAGLSTFPTRCGITPSAG